jgi:hypothetical protein
LMELFPETIDDGVNNLCSKTKLVVIFIRWKNIIPVTVHNMV